MSGTAKRARLVEAAQQLAYERGFQRSTLAEIATAADVPLGNVYYYFKTKDAIGEAVLEQRLADYRALRASWEALPGARERLVAFVQMTADSRDELASLGCPIGSLCTELRKGRAALGPAAAALFEDWLAWLERQFRAIGAGGRSPALAERLLAELQGAIVLANALGDPRYVDRASERAKEWVLTA